MKNTVKSRKEDADDSCSFSRLPDEMILQIFNKVIDMKTICFCYLVSKRFSSVVLQVDAISFTSPFLNPCNTIGDVDGCGFRRKLARLLMKPHESFLSNFKGLKSLCVEFPSSSDRATDNRCLFKWKVKFSHRIESFIYLSPMTICGKDGIDLNGNGDEENGDEEYDYELLPNLFKQNIDYSLLCLKDVMVWHLILLQIVKYLPTLEEIFIADSGRRGRLSLSGEKLNEVKKWVNSGSGSETNHVKIPDVVSNGYIPVLKLPDSGYVMKRIYCGVMEMKDLQGGYDFLKKSKNGFEDKQEGIYSEAMMEILEKHRGIMRTYNPVGGLV